MLGRMNTVAVVGLNGSYNCTREIAIHWPRRRVRIANVPQWECPDWFEIETYAFIFKIWLDISSYGNEATLSIRERADTAMGDRNRRHHWYVWFLIPPNTKNTILVIWNSQCARFPLISRAIGSRKSGDGTHSCGTLRTRQLVWLSFALQPAVHRMKFSRTSWILAIFQSIVSK